MNSKSIENKPVVRWFLPGTGFVWLISELDSNNLDRGFGICYLATQKPIVGIIEIDRLKQICLSNRRRIKRDTTFKAQFTVETYMLAAEKIGRFTEEVDVLCSVNKIDGVLNINDKLSPK